ENIQFEVGTTTAGSPGTQQPAATVPATNATADTRQTTTDPSDQYRTELDRVNYIHQMATTLNVKDETVRKAISEKWNLEKINTEFAATTTERSEPLTPAIHSKAKGLNLRTLQAAVLMRAGIEVDAPMLRSREAAHLLGDRQNMFGGQRNDASWIANHSRS